VYRTFLDKLKEDVEEEKNEWKNEIKIIIRIQSQANYNFNLMQKKDMKPFVMQ